MKGLARVAGKNLRRTYAIFHQVPSGGYEESRRLLLVLGVISPMGGFYAE